MSADPPPAAQLPNDPEAWSALAAGRFDEGDAIGAEAMFRAGIQAFPASELLLFNLASLLLGLGRTAEAEPLLEAVCELDPDDHEAWLRLGRLRYRRADHHAAAEAFRNAARTHGELRSGALRLAGFALADGGMPSAAAAALEEAIAAGGAADLPLLSQLLFCRLELCDWHDREKLVADCLSLLEAGEVPAEPFTFLLLDEISPSLQLELSRRYCALLAGVLRPASPGNPAQAGRRLRLGYLGDVFHEHAIVRLAVGVIERHDRARFEVHGFSYGPDDTGPMRQRLVAACDAFHDIRGLDVNQSAEYIRAQEIDLLIDLNGWTGNTRSAALALRPARVQINWWGYPATMGDRRLADYLIGDPVVTPLTRRAEYAEVLALMPHSYQPNDRSRRVGSIPSRGGAGLPDAGFVFCCFNRALKISPVVFGHWCEILSQVEGSVLWLLAGPPQVEANLKREALHHGVEPERLVFAPSMPQEEHLGRLALADLVLDSHPYGAHTTASDALWVGVPVLTRTGESFPSRVATSLLAACGLPELAVADARGYVELAVALAGDASRLGALRARLAANRLTTPLFDTDGFARDFDALLQQIWRHHLAGGTEPIELRTPG